MMPTVVIGNRPIFKGFRGFSSHKSDFRGFSIPSNSTFLFSRVCTNPAILSGF